MSPSVAPSEPVLEVDGLTTEFVTRNGTVRAVDGVSLRLYAGETLGVVGESGCGKSVTALSILGLIPSPPGRRVAGRIMFEGRDLARLTQAELRSIRGDQIAMVFQEPMTSLNPLIRIGEQIAEAVRLHQGLARKPALGRAAEMLRLVRIPDPVRALALFPHQLSGGMRQRVMIAMALACRPKILLADEPTTALDVTIQSQILTLIAELKATLGIAVMLITHDLGVVAATAQRVAVMYAGRKVEEAAVDDLFARPLHPYTRGLMAAIPRLDAIADAPARLAEIPGVVPALDRAVAGCAFAPRCGMATPRCRVAAPPLEQWAPDHLAACWEIDPIEAAA